MSQLRLMGSPIAQSSRLAYTCSTQIIPGGKLKEAHTVHFVEMVIEALVDPSTSFDKAWMDGVPPISGAILCYDATRSSTLAGIADGLSESEPGV